MRKSIPTIVALALAAGGCASANDHAINSLEAEVRRLRSEQERMAAQLDQINNRLVLTEDTARAAHNAVEGAGRMRTISLGTDGPRSEPIRVDSTTRGAPEEDAGGDDASRTTLRVSRGDRPSEPRGFQVLPQLPPNERLPVAPAPPVPPPGAPAPRPAPAPTTGAGRGPGASLDVPSGTLDPGAVPAYDEALALARGGRCAEAVDAFARFLVRWPDHPHADNAMYWRGECFLQGGDARRAAQEFEGLVARFPAGNKVADALYKLSVTYGRLGDRAAADRAVQRLRTEFPDSEAARRVRGEREGS